MINRIILTLFTLTTILISVAKSQFIPPINIISNSTGCSGWSGNASYSSILVMAQAMASCPDATTPTLGGTLTINSNSLGNYDFTIKTGPQTVSSFSNSDWFTATEDTTSTFIVIKGDFTVNSGQIFTPSQRKLFTVIYATGNCSIAGSILMTARGSNHSGAGSSGGATTAATIRIATGTFSGVTNPEVPAAGGAALAATFRSSGTNDGPGTTGNAGSAGGTGGGGRAGAYASTGYTARHGGGAAGTSFSGGAGGAGSQDGGNGTTTADGQANGGKGGVAFGINTPGGGAGNPGGAGVGAGATGGAGSGGVLIIICAGQLSGAGVISAAGEAGGTSTLVGGGAGSGGGSVTVMYGTDTSSITPTAPGGAGGGDHVSYNSAGGAGGAGTARKLAL